jgi:uncharacterized membrane protein
MIEEADLKPRLPMSEKLRVSRYGSALPNQENFMTTNQKITSLAVAGALASAIALTVAPVEAADDMEKCFGIAKAGQNDCAAEGSNSCAGTSKVDFDKHGWKLVKKGTCTTTSVSLPDGSTRNGALEPIKG